MTDEDKTPKILQDLGDAIRDAFQEVMKDFQNPESKLWRDIEEEMLRISTPCPKVPTETHDEQVKDNVIENVAFETAQRSPLQTKIPDSSELGTAPFQDRCEADPESFATIGHLC